VKEARKVTADDDPRRLVVPQGARVRLGEPAAEPTALLRSIASTLGAVAAVREARRVWAQVDDGAPGLVIGIDIDPDTPAARGDAVAAVGAAYDAEVIGFDVHVVFRHDQSEFIAWMAENAPPFYVRTLEEQP
jgi:hypothetical protein